MSTSNYSRLFGALVKVKRVEKGLTQQDLVDSCGLTRPTLSKIESGEIPNPHKKTITALIKKLEISFEKLERLESFPKALDCDSGIRILLSDEGRKGLNNENVIGIFEKAAAVTAFTADSSKKPEMYGRVALAIAITEHKMSFKVTC